MPNHNIRLRLPVRYRLQFSDCDAPLRCLYDNTPAILTYDSCMRHHTLELLSRHAIPEPSATSIERPIATTRATLQYQCALPMYINSTPLWAGKTDHASAVSDVSSSMRPCDNAPNAGPTFAPIPNWSRPGLAYPFTFWFISDASRGFIHLVHRFAKRSTSRYPFAF